MTRSNLVALLRLLLALLALLPAAPFGVSHEPMTLNEVASSRERPAEPGDDGLGVRSGGSASVPAQDASTVTFEGILAYAAPSHGPLYLAIRQPRGTRVEVCGPASCLTRISTDFGPSAEMARQGRIADVSSTDFVSLCGVPLSFGVCNGTLTLVGLPATDLEGTHD